ncbi:MAG TPA: hypothetical protein VGX46_16805, partial [Vicinamibacterales bacterium]|nr:hypothetical protein [Vicinamibacterales bacterium]
ARGAAVSALPWLHTKYIVLLILLAPFLVWRAKRRPIDAMALLLPIALSLAAWMYFFYAIYGVFDPQAPYGGSVAGLLLQNVPRGVLGLLLDQKFGLLVYSPMYVFAASGMWLALQKRELRVPALAAICAGGAFVISTSRLFMWWGGGSAPARFLVPVVPLWAPFVALAVSCARTALARAAIAMCVIIGLAAAGLGTAFPNQRLLFSDPHGTSRLIDMVQGAAAWSMTLPTFTEASWRQPLASLALWLVALAVAIAAAMLVARQTHSRRVFWTAIAGTLTLVVTAGALTRNIAAAQRQQISLRGQTDLLSAYDGPRLRLFDYRRLMWLDDPWLAGLMTVRVTNVQGSETRSVVAGPVSLPAGEYVARVSPVGGIEGTLHASVVLADLLSLAARDGGLIGPVEIPFELPVDVDDVSVHVDLPSEASNLPRVDVFARRIVAHSARPAAFLRGIDSMADRPGALLIYADDNTYPEGPAFWTKNTEPGTVLIAPAGAAAVAVTLHVGTVADVDVQAEKEHSSFHMTPSEDREILVPVPAGSSWVSLRVRASASFRPAETEPHSNDTRRLGCYVRLSLR